jgi:CheY-like chemotaxis protein
VIWNRRAMTTRANVYKSARQRSHPTLLWIDDFEPGLDMYKAMFEDLGFRVLTASSGEAGLRLATLNRVDMVVTDYEMRGMDGEAVAAAVKAKNSRIPVVLFSGSTLVPLRARRVVDAFCDKAGSRDQLLITIHHLLHKKHTRSLQPPPLASASDHGQRTVA